MAVILVGLIPVLPVVLAGHTLGPFGTLAPMVRTELRPPVAPWDVLQADAVLQFYGWRDLVLQSWRAGEVPWWNPYAFGGNPLLANSQSGALYPLHVLLGLAHVPTPQAVWILAAAHLALAGLGATFLARRIGASHEGALVGGLAFAWSPFLLAWLGLGSVPATVAWIPWLLGFVLEAFTVPRPRRAIIGIAITTALLLLAGHLQFAAFGLMAAGVVALGGGIQRLRRAKDGVSGSPWGAWGGVTLGLVVGGCLAAPQLLPVLEGSGMSHRRNVPTAEGYAAYAASALPARDWGGRMVNPMATGSPVRPSAVDPQVSQFWPAIAQRGANYAESAGTLGAVVVALLFLVPWRRLGAAGWSVAVVGAVGWAIAAGTPLAQALYFVVPGWSSTGSPGRAIVLVVLAGCVLAARGLTSAMGPGEGRTPASALLLRAGVGFLLVWALSFTLSLPGAAPGPVGQDAWIALTTIDWAGWMLGLVGGLVTLGLAGATAPGRTLPVSPAVGIAGVVLFLTASSGTLALVRGGDPSEVRWAGPIPTGRAAFLNQDWELLVGAPAGMPPNLATLSRIPDIAGYDSLTPKSTQELLAQINGQDPSPPANGNLMFVKPTASPERLREAGVTDVFYRPDRPPTGPGWPAAEPDLTPGGFRHVRLGGPGLVDRGGVPGRLEWQGLNQALVTLPPGEGRVTLRVRALPGWSIQSTAGTVEFTTGDWLTVDRLPEDVTQLTLTYAPARRRADGLVAFLGGLALAGVALLTRSPRPSRSASDAVSSDNSGSADPETPVLK